MTRNIYVPFDRIVTVRGFNHWHSSVRFMLVSFTYLVASRILPSLRLVHIRDSFLCTPMICTLAALPVPLSTQHPLRQTKQKMKPVLALTLAALAAAVPVSQDAAIFPRDDRPDYSAWDKHCGAPMLQTCLFVGDYGKSGDIGKFLSCSNGKATLYTCVGGCDQDLENFEHCAGCSPVLTCNGAQLDMKAGTPTGVD